MLYDVIMTLYVIPISWLFQSQFPSAKSPLFLGGLQFRNAYVVATVQLGRYLQAAQLCGMSNLVFPTRIPHDSQRVPY